MLAFHKKLFLGPSIYLKGTKLLSKRPQWRTRALCDITEGGGGGGFLLFFNDVLLRPYDLLELSDIWKNKVVEREELTPWGTVRYQYPL